MKSVIAAIPEDFSCLVRNLNLRGLLRQHGFFASVVLVDFLRPLLHPLLCSLLRSLLLALHVPKKCCLYHVAIDISCDCLHNTSQHAHLVALALALVLAPYLALALALGPGPGQRHLLWSLLEVVGRPGPGGGGGGETGPIEAMQPVQDKPSTINSCMEWSHP